MHECIAQETARPGAGLFPFMTGVLFPAGSPEQPVDLGKDAGKVELVVAGFAGRGEIGTGPVAVSIGEFGVMLASPAADAVVFVVGIHASEIAEPGPGAGGGRATAVAVPFRRAGRAVFQIFLEEHDGLHLPGGWPRTGLDHFTLLPDFDQYEFRQVSFAYLSSPV